MVIFAGQVSFILHPACDAMNHIKLSTSSSPIQTKSVDDNNAFLECTSPISMMEPSSLFYFSDVKYRICYKKHLEVVDNMTKYVGKSIKHLMSLSASTSFIRLITFDFKSDVDQSVSMLES